MAEEFYAYAERQANSQVNWAKIGRDLSKTLADEAFIREQKRAAIDEATNKSLSELANAPIGSADDGNKFTIDYSHNAQQSLLLANRLMKSGQMSVKDYSLFKANLDSGTTQLFNLQKEYQKWFDIKKERMYSNDPKNKAQAIEGDAQGWMESFGDFSKSSAVINPMTGQISVGIMKENADGIMELSNEIMSVQDMYKSLGQKYDYFPSSQAASAIADKLAPVVITQIEAGSINEKGEKITYDDPLQREAIKNKHLSESNTQKAMNDAINSFLNIPTNVTSILTDDIGDYYNVRSEEEQKKDPGHAILWKVDIRGTWAPELTDSQKKAAYDYLKLQTEARVHQKVDKDLFEPQAVVRAELNLKSRNITVAEKNANTAASNAANKGAEVDGKEWETYVRERVPSIASLRQTYGPTGMVDENAIRTLNTNFAPLGLSFEQGPKNTGESVVIVDSNFDPPAKSQPISLKDPNAEQLISDYIVTAKVDVGKNLIATGVINKNVKSSGGKKTFKGLDANGMPILE